MNTAAWVWLILLVAFLIVEANTVSLVSVWFAGGALAAMIAALFDAGYGIQIALFIAVSGILLALLRPVLRKYIRPKLIKTNVDAIIGTKGIVIAEINNDLAQGRVTLGSMEWAARSTDGMRLPAGIPVQVDGIEGVKVFVSPVKVKEPMSSIQIINGGK